MDGASSSGRRSSGISYLRLLLLGPSHGRVRRSRVGGGEGAPGAQVKGAMAADGAAAQTAAGSN